jgi:hypothetical protein
VRDGPGMHSLGDLHVLIYPPPESLAPAPEGMAKPSQNSKGAPCLEKPLFRGKKVRSLVRGAFRRGKVRSLVRGAAQKRKVRNLVRGAV